jgi:hypothetical protein
MSQEPHLNYPFPLPSFCPGLDDGQFCQRELKEESRSWRSEKYPPASNVLVFDHDHGVGTTGVYNDADIDLFLAVRSSIISHCFVLIFPSRKIDNHSYESSYFIQRQRRESSGLFAIRKS